jgi:hypothetical protein
MAYRHLIANNSPRPLQLADPLRPALGRGSLRDSSRSAYGNLRRSLRGRPLAVRHPRGCTAARSASMSSGDPVEDVCESLFECVLGIHGCAVAD